MTCFAEAWKEVSDLYPQADLTFFGAPGQTLNATALENGEILPTSERTKRAFSYTAEKDSVVLAEYDFFVLIGARTGAGVAAQLQRQHRLIGQTGRTKVRNLVSDAAFQAAMYDYYRTGAIGHLASLLKAGGVSAPVFVYSSPNADIRVTKMDNIAGALYREYVEAPDPVPILRMAQQTDDRLRAEGLIPIPQSPETVVNDIMTDSRFSIYADALAKGADPDGDDVRHMNAAFGKLALKDLFNRLAEEQNQPKTDAA
ncbi:hypothetical protein [Pseudoruegeria sp. SHC-113]|uniref:hypothetical protein n=1 Tax=Pseudoruegeria sp. SHC-113 TaxID=2855439 RepID=UPI0021BACA2B|nr:hypothetical protein [Pseudoruegeria sp. SHC-113]MCT8159966.1 hypothetical protein [Pseudoruegeria sp. SHC-113]